MASKEQIQSALNELWEKYGNTLSMLSDSLDILDKKDARIAELESQLTKEPEVELNLTLPPEIAALEEKVLNRTNEQG